MGNISLSSNMTFKELYSPVGIQRIIDIFKYQSAAIRYWCHLKLYRLLAIICQGLLGAGVESSSLTHFFVLVSISHSVDFPYNR